ncbi:MAG: iron donor protein CyaY [Gammaproteobacteria bacterium]|jgi:CyaY protein|nr:iron donor protein CyaY [Gammaproteobacteria bacterium]|tara:strand:- start:1556 stop:1879 length:324 start_codon:yes stop_codon:yes gene_type:complete
MQDAEYEERVDQLFNAIEDEIDEVEADIDVDASAGILTIEFPDSSHVILSRQIANREVWIAARSGGYHLALDDDEWYCRTSSESLSVLLNRVFTEQLGKVVSGFDLH